MGTRVTREKTMSLFNTRTNFTLAWESLSPYLKSAIISTGAFLLAAGLLTIAKSLFPIFDFTQVEIIIVTAFCGFLVSFVKENIKL